MNKRKIKQTTKSAMKLKKFKFKLEQIIYIIYK